MSTYVVLFLVLSAAVIESDGVQFEKKHKDVCKEVQVAPDKAPPHEHFWPHVRGIPGQYGVTSLKGPANMNASLAWSWHHPDGRYRTTLIGGGIIDSDKNIYIATTDAIWKLSRTGETLWTHKPREGNISNAPVLMGTSLFGNTQEGVVFALSLDTGKELWSKKYGKSIGTDTAYVEAHNGVVISGIDAGGSEKLGGGNTRMLGLNAENGEQLWDFTLDIPVWNVMPMFPDDNSTIFMDFAGGLYRLGLHDGKVIWHTPPPANSSGSFTDGGVILGPNGSAYTCSAPGTAQGSHGDLGALRKFRLSDGEMLWNTELPHPCNSWPAVSADGKSVIAVPGAFVMQPFTLQADNETEGRAIHEHLLSLGNGQRAWLREQGLPLEDLPASIMAFDTQTGELQWRHDVEPYGGIAAAGDEEGIIDRLTYGHRPFCLPAHWGSPTISSEGTVYVGRTNGDLYAYNPKKTRENTYHTGTGPLHSGVAFAPGMMVYTDCDSLYVWNTESGDGLHKSGGSRPLVGLISISMALIMGLLK